MRTKSFDKLVAAQCFQAIVKADMARGHYVDESAGHVTFHEYSESWLVSRSTEITTEERVGGHPSQPLHACMSRAGGHGPQPELDQLRCGAQHLWQQ
jgi:hypothetical protein